MNELAAKASVAKVRARSIFGFVRSEELDITMTRVRVVCLCALLAVVWWCGMGGSKERVRGDWMETFILDESIEHFSRCIVTTRSIETTAKVNTPHIPN